MHDTHLMVDTETAGSIPSVAPLSIAAKRFTRKKMKQDLHVNIDLASAIGAGLNIDPDTLIWWKSQPQFDAIRVSAAPLEEALQQLQEFFDEDRTVWARGTDFDIGLVLRPAFDAVGLDAPWSYNQVRDLRTIAANRPEESTHHPVEDCEAQVRQLWQVWRETDGLYEQTMP